MQSKPTLKPTEVSLLIITHQLFITNIINNNYCLISIINCLACMAAWSLAD
jgi:hypothetical protein